MKAEFDIKAPKGHILGTIEFPKDMTKLDAEFFIAQYLLDNFYNSSFFEVMGFVVYDEDKNGKKA